MKKGLLLGKFMPIHKGHMALIDYARQHCDKLYVLVCANDDIEPIPGKIRLQWVKDIYNNIAGIEVCYTEDKIPYTAHSCRNISALWAEFLRKNYGDIDIFFSSEPYGDYVAEYLNIQHIPFDPARTQVAISASKIREQPFLYWHFIPEVVQPYFIKKICLCGTESTGKSTLVERLARHFDTSFVPEVTREIVTQSQCCSFQDLITISKYHANEILKQSTIANKLLFLDTNLLATKAYGNYLFQQEPEFENWIEEANTSHLYLFLDKDVPFVQDGTRLNEEERNELHQYHLQQLLKANVPFHIIRGSYEERFRQACEIIKSLLPKEQITPI